MPPITSINTNPNVSDFASGTTSPDLKKVYSQGLTLGLIAGGVHGGLSLAGLDNGFKSTPLASALFFGLMPVVHNAAQTVFKNYIVNQNSKDNRQIKAQALIATVSAAFCTPICNTAVYNIFADILGLKQWGLSDMFHQQINLMLYYPALAAGMNMMIEKGFKTLLTAQGLSDEEIKTQMLLAKSKNILQPVAI